MNILITLLAVVVLILTLLGTFGSGWTRRVRG